MIQTIYGVGDPSHFVTTQQVDNAIKAVVLIDSHTFCLAHARWSYNLYAEQPLLPHQYSLNVPAEPLKPIAGNETNSTLASMDMGVSHNLHPAVLRFEKPHVET